MKNKQKNFFRHVGIVVKDLEKTILFYQKLFYLKIEKKLIEKGEFISHILNIKNIELISAKLSDSSGNIVVEFLEFKKIQSKNINKIPKKFFDYGITHFALTVEDISYYNRILKKNKIEIINTPKISEDGKHKVLFFRDLNNCLVELVQSI